jgi:hypothetical protein
MKFNVILSANKCPQNFLLIKSSGRDKPQRPMFCKDASEDVNSTLIE